MKKVVLFSTLALGLALVGGASQVNAAKGDEGVVTTPESHSTQTAVTIENSGTGTGGGGDFDPQDPKGALDIKSVPENYNFKTALNGTDTTTISANNLDENVIVFNNDNTRKWSVKATLKDSKITRKTDNTDLAVSSFMINGADAIKTGADAVVATSPETAKNSGLISTAIDTIGITFNTANADLKVGDNLTGQIDYTLYNTPDASVK